MAQTNKALVQRLLKEYAHPPRSDGHPKSQRNFRGIVKYLLIGCREHRIASPDWLKASAKELRRGKA